MCFFSKFKISSRFPRAVRASPWLIFARSSRASFSIFVSGDIFASVFVIISDISERDNGFKVKIRLREINGVIISKLGFSVVAPIRFIKPLSI